MDFHRLRIFLTVAEELHFRRAAERLHMTQPPVSAAIKKLEEELGVRLFDRHNRKVCLTPAGECLQSKGEALLAQVANVEDAVRRVADGSAGTLTMAFVGIANILGLPKLIARFHQEYPEVALSLHEYPTRHSIDELKAGKLDLAFVRGEPEDPLDYISFLDEPYWVAIPEGHALSQLSEIPMSALDKVPINFFPRKLQPTIYDEWIVSFRAAGVSPHFVQEIRSVGAELGLVAAGVGVAFVTKTISTQSKEGIVFRPLIGDCPSVEVNVAWHPERISETAERFIAMLSE